MTLAGFLASDHHATLKYRAAQGATPRAFDQLLACPAVRRSWRSLCWLHCFCERARPLNMRFVSELSLVAAILSVASAALIAHGPVSECANEQIAETTYIGADKNVKVTFSHCANEEIVNAQGEPESKFNKRQSSNVCGNTCTFSPSVRHGTLQLLTSRCTGNTYCWANATGGPTTSDCTVIADALLYESQNTGVFFNATAFGVCSTLTPSFLHDCSPNYLKTPTNKITMVYNTCETYFLNQDTSNITYCRTEWVWTPPPLHNCPFSHITLDI